MSGAGPGSRNHRALPPPLADHIERLLIVCPTWIGDTVMATPVLRAARASLPQARIIAAIRPGLDELLHGCPWLDELVPVNMKGPLGPVGAAHRLRQHRPDAILLLPNSFRAALTARLTRAPIRIGYDREHRGMLLTHTLTPPPLALPTPTLDYYARLAAFTLGCESIDTPMELSVTGDEDRAADELLADVDEPFVLLNPGANKRAKRWPADRFARVAEALRDSHGLGAVVSGSPRERDVLAQVAAAARCPIVNAGARGMRLGPLKAVTRRAALLITNDTGPRHVAAALGIPVVTLFGPTDPRWTELRYPKESVIRAEPFLPQELVADRFPTLCAIGRIAVEDVLASSRRLLDEQCASDR